MTNKITLLGVSTLTVLIMTGCSGTPVAKVPIPAYVKPINTAPLTKENQEKIEAALMVYRDPNRIPTPTAAFTANPISALFQIGTALDSASLALDYASKKTYKPKDIDLSKEKLYKCDLEGLWGNPTIYYNSMYVINKNKIMVGLNAYDVNDFHIFTKPPQEDEIFTRKSGEKVFVSIEWDPYSFAQAQSQQTYKCIEVPNTVFVSGR